MRAQPDLCRPPLSTMSSLLSPLLFGAVSVAAALHAPVRPAILPARSHTAAVNMMADRTPLMAGNWKMNTVLDEAVALAKAVAAASEKADGVDVAVCVPYPFIVPVKEALAGSKVGLGAQDCYYEESGAYTGQQLVSVQDCTSV
eukprot:4147635-Pleurochrysis_carterae.AAC.5